MLRSLVGSEMCIRDSAMTAISEHVLRQKLPPQPQFKPVAIRSDHSLSQSPSFHRCRHQFTDLTRFLPPRHCQHIIAVRLVSSPPDRHYHRLHYHRASLRLRLRQSSTSPPQFEQSSKIRADDNGTSSIQPNTRSSAPSAPTLSRLNLSRRLEPS